MNLIEADNERERRAAERRAYATNERDQQLRPPWVPPSEEEIRAMQARELGKPKRRRKSRSMWAP